METAIRQGLSDQVRDVALEKYVRPALRAGRTEFSISVKEMLVHLKAKGFPENHIPQICTALQGLKFLKENGLGIERIDGPPSKMSTTVVITYVRQRKTDATRDVTAGTPVDRPDEDPKVRIRRLAGSLRGLLKDDFARFGGGEAFFRWLRDEDSQ